MSVRECAIDEYARHGNENYCGRSQLYCKQIDDPFYPGGGMIRRSFKATVKSSEKKYYVNRRDPLHKEMERALCVVAGTPKTAFHRSCRCGA
jgi:hypothetical protein